MANSKFVTVDSNGAQVNQELGPTIPGYTANSTYPAPVLVVPIDAIADATSSFTKAVPTSQGGTYRIVAVQVVKAAAMGGANDTVALINNGDSVTGNVSVMGMADKATQWLPIDDAYQTYTAGNPLVASTVKVTSNPSCYVYVYLVKLT